MSTAPPEMTIDLVLDRPTTKEVLRAVLHSILFHRLFGTVKPTTFDVLDVTMPAVDDPEITRLVDEKVDVFWRNMESGVVKRGQILVTFSEKRPKKNWLISLLGDDEVPWELWTINAEVRQPTTAQERQKYKSDLSSTLTKSLKAMMNHTSSERGRSAVPPITHAQGISPFPYKIVVKVGGVEIPG